MKKLVLLSLVLSLIIFPSTKAQDRFITKTGQVWFHSKTRIKEIEAYSKQVTSVLDTKTGDVFMSGFLMDFKFDNQLIEEHFNENYVESAKFPKVKFKGKMQDISIIDFSKNATYKRRVIGVVEMHGKSVNINKEVKAVVKDGKIKVNVFFTITTEDFAINIPEILLDKLHKNIDINIEFIYVPFTM